MSARVALRAAGERFGYPELAQLLRRRGVVQGDLHAAQMRELFRRMLFNIARSARHKPQTSLCPSRGIVRDHVC